MKTNDIPKAHPSLLDALHRQDAKAHEMRPSEGFTEKVMEKVKSERVNFRSSESNQARLNCRVVTKVSEAKSEKYKSLFIRKIAAVFIVVAFLGGLAWAFVPLLRSQHTAEPTQPTKVSAPSLTGRAGGGSSISFSNLRLDSILTIVAAHYECEVCFRDTTAQALRLSTVWDREDSLSVFLETLNEFDGLRLTDERDTIFVESLMVEDK
jgi:hypothetical protein